MSADSTQSQISHTIKQATEKESTSSSLTENNDHNVAADQNVLTEVVDQIADNKEEAAPLPDSTQITNNLNNAMSASVNNEDETNIDTHTTSVSTEGALPELSKSEKELHNDESKQSHNFYNTPEEELLNVLSQDVNEQSKISLKELQRLCMRVPTLSQKLTGPMRCRLYEQLLMTNYTKISNNNNNNKKSNVDTNTHISSATMESPSSVLDAERTDSTHLNFEEYEGTLSETQSRIANKIYEWIINNSNDSNTVNQRVELENFPTNNVVSKSETDITRREVEGFVKYVTSESEYKPLLNDEYTQALLLIATVVKQAEVKLNKVFLQRLCKLFLSIHKDFLVPASSYAYETVIVLLLRLLLQYHDPELSSHLDHNKVQIGRNLLTLSRALFVRNDNYTTALEIMDWVFVLGDPLMIPFTAIAYLITHRKQFLTCNSELDLHKIIETAPLPVSQSKENAVNPCLVDGRTITMIPVWTGKVLLQNAEILYRNTPISTRRIIEFCLYPDGGSVNQSTEALVKYYENAPCLPLERVDLISSFAVESNNSSTVNTAMKSQTPELPIEYVVIDCRSKVSFDYARLPTALCIGDVIGYDEKKLNSVIERIAPCKGMHLTIFGTGRPITEEYNLMKVLAFHCVAKCFPYVSMAIGGFKSIIPLSRTHAIRLITNKNANMHESTFSVSQAAETTTHAVAAALENIKEKLPNVTADGDKIRQTAEEIKDKAKEKLSAVSAWGKNVFFKVQSKLNETRQSATLSNLKNETSQSSNHDKCAREKNEQNCVFQGTVKPLHSMTNETNNHPLFSLGDNDEEDDDFGLITSVPARPLRGVLLSTPETTTTTTTTGAVAERKTEQDVDIHQIKTQSTIEASQPVENATSISPNVPLKLSPASTEQYTTSSLEGQVNVLNKPIEKALQSNYDETATMLNSPKEITKENEIELDAKLRESKALETKNTTNTAEHLHLFDKKNNWREQEQSQKEHQQQHPDLSSYEHKSDNKKELSAEMTVAEITDNIEAEFEELFGKVGKS